MTISTIQLALLLLLQNTRSGGHAGGQERAPGGQGGQQGGQQGAQQGGQVAVTAHQLKEVLLPVCENMVQVCLCWYVCMCWCVLVYVCIITD